MKIVLSERQWGKESMDGNKTGKLSNSNFVVRYFRENGGIMIALLLLCAFFALNSEAFLTRKNLINVLRQISMNGIVAVGLTYTLLVVGVDLSVGSVISAAGCLAVLLLVQGLPLPLCFLAALLLGAVVGTCNGTLISVVGMPPFIATLTMQTIVRGVAYAITGGYPTLFDNDTFYSIGNGYIGIIPVPVIIMFTVFLIASIVLNKTRHGRNMYAVGGNKEAALFSGINNKKVILCSYIISGCLAAITGIIMMARLSSAQPTAGEGMESDAIAAAVIGGTSFSGGIGKVGGTLIGALIIGVLNNGLNLLGVEFYWQYIAKGLVLGAALIIDILKNNKEFSLKAIFGKR